MAAEHEWWKESVSGPLDTTSVGRWREEMSADARRFAASPPRRTTCASTATRAREDARGQVALLPVGAAVGPSNESLLLELARRDLVVQRPSPSGRRQLHQAQGQRRLVYVGIKGQLDPSRGATVLLRVAAAGVTAVGLVVRRVQGRPVLWLRRNTLRPKRTRDPVERLLAPLLPSLRSRGRPGRGADARGPRRGRAWIASSATRISSRLPVATATFTPAMPRPSSRPARCATCVASGSWLLTRAIPGSERRDAIVGYPHLVSRDARALSEDLRETAALADVVTVSALTDPLASLDEELLRPSFPDLVRVDAQHYLADLVSFWPARDHRRAAREALRSVDVEVEDAPASLPGRWAAPHRRRRCPASSWASPRGRSRACWRYPAASPSPHSPRTVRWPWPSSTSAETTPHVHALTSSPAGEELGARYALVQTMVEDMAGRGLRFLDLGTAEADLDFMDGWTETLRPSFRCGRVVDRVAYEQLTAAAGTSGSGAFPAYRDPAARLGA